MMIVLVDGKNSISHPFLECEFNSGSGQIQRNTISGNGAGMWGGAMHCCGGRVRDNIITGNYADYGGAFSLGDAVVSNNVICRNSALHGGAVAWYEFGTIANCIFWANRAPEDPQFHGCAWATYSRIEAGGSLDTNIPDDPRFVNPGHWDGTGTPGDLSDDVWVDGEYHLKPDSPCIDRGSNSFVDLPEFDMDGNQRIAKGRDSLTVDMGAYEHGSFPFGIVRTERKAGGETELSWSSRPGDAYTIWSCTNLHGGQWNEETTILSRGQSTTWTDPNTASNRKFYRIGIK